MILTQHKYNHLARVPPNPMREASGYFRVKSTRTCRYLKDYRQDLQSVLAKYFGEKNARMNTKNTKRMTFPHPTPVFFG